MKVAIYSPYLDTLGGGERYMMSIAEVLSKPDIRVDVLLDGHLFKIGADYLKKQLTKRFGLNLSRVNFLAAPIGGGSNFVSRHFFLKTYDVCFYLTDGSIFYPSSKKNFLHIQSPLVGQPAKSTWGKKKLAGWDLIIYNSTFTKQAAQNYWPIKSEVIYPPVDTDVFKPLKKEKIILSVGRFFGFLKDKKQEILIDTFIKIQKQHKLTGWSLALAGSAKEGDLDYLDNLKKQAGKFEVKFFPNLEYDELINLYGRSSIYWHGAGYQETDPTKMEHFGISTVEAMAAGAVPVVIGLGGQVEIVENGKSGLLWNSLDQLEEETLRVVEDEKLFAKLSKAAIERAKNFSKEKFREKILNLI